MRGRRPSRFTASPHAVADAVHGGDLRGIGQTGQLAPQARDVGVEGVLVDEGSVGPGDFDEGVAAHHFAGRRGQPGEQAELGRRERGDVPPLMAACAAGSSRSAPTSTAGSPPARRRSASRRATSSAKAKGLVR